jgi:hypothetical protein
VQIPQQHRRAGSPPDQTAGPARAVTQTSYVPLQSSNRTRFSHDAGSTVEKFRVLL